MSYNFSVRGANRAEVLERVGLELDKVKDAQPMHAHDRDQALAAAKAFIEILPDSLEGHEIQVYMHGSVGWHQGRAEEPNVITGAGVGVSAHWMQVAPQASPAPAS